MLFYYYYSLNWFVLIIGKSIKNISSLNIITIIYIISEVHKGVHKATNALVALKRILMHNEREGVSMVFF